MKAEQTAQDETLQQTRTEISEQQKKILHDLEAKKQQITESQSTQEERLTQELETRLTSLKKELETKNHQLWEAFVRTDGGKQENQEEEVLVQLMKGNQANFFSFLAGGQDLFEMPRNDLVGAKGGGSGKTVPAGKGESEESKKEEEAGDGDFDPGSKTFEESNLSLEDEAKSKSELD